MLSNTYKISKKIARSVFVVDYPCSLKTLGDHVRKKRLDLMLEQTEVAKIIDTNKCTIANWENNRAVPSIEYIPKIISFLDYIPSDLFNANTLSEKVAMYRQLHGITQQELAMQLSIDPSTIMHWESGKHKPSTKLINRLRKLLDF